MVDLSCGAEWRDSSCQPVCVPNRLGSTAQVREVVASFCADPRREFCPDNISLADSGLLARPELLTPSRVSDLYLLALAAHRDVKLATFDRRRPAEAISGGRQALAVLGS